MWSRVKSVTSFERRSGKMRVSLLLIKRDGETVSVRIDGHEFDCEEEHGEPMIPKRFLVGFRLSEIPAGIVIKTG
jgi:hypothetical protein